MMFQPKCAEKKFSVFLLIFKYIESMKGTFRISEQWTLCVINCS